VTGNQVKRSPRGEVPPGSVSLNEFKKNSTGATKEITWSNLYKGNSSRMMKCGDKGDCDTEGRAHHVYLLGC